MADAKLARNVTRPDPIVGQLDNPLPDQVRQGPPIDEDSTELVYSTVTCFFLFFFWQKLSFHERKTTTTIKNGEEVSISKVRVVWRGWREFSK